MILLSYQAFVASWFFRFGSSLDFSFLCGTGVRFSFVGFFSGVWVVASNSILHIGVGFGLSWMVLIFS